MTTRYAISSTVLLATLAGCIGEPAAPSSVAVEPASASLSLGDTLTLMAQVLGAEDQLLQSAPTWSVDNARIVTVGANGVARARGVGTTTVTAEVGNRSGEATLSVGVRLASIVAGVGHTCGVDSSARLACWGSNTWAQLGDGTLFSIAAPTRAVDSLAISSMTLGASMACVLRDDATAACWGINLSGQLGRGTADAEPHGLPTPVMGLMAFRQIDAGARHVCGVTLDDEAWCWGGDFFGQLGIDGASSLCEFTAEPCSQVPAQVSGSIGWRMVSTGAEHSCGIDLAGVAYCWGFNLFGQLGDSTQTTRSTPAPVYDTLAFMTVSAGPEHTCGLTVDSLAYCWGENAGRLGNNDLALSVVPVPVSGGHRFQSVASGRIHTCGLTVQDTVLCWGFNSQGQVGLGTVEPVLVPTLVAVGAAVRALSVGFQYNCAMTVNDVAVCWGANGSGQLGRGFASGGLPQPQPVTGQN